MKKFQKYIRRPRNLGLVLNHAVNGFFLFLIQVADSFQRNCDAIFLDLPPPDPGYPVVGQLEMTEEGLAAQHPAVRPRVSLFFARPPAGR